MPSPSWCRTPSAPSLSSQCRSAPVPAPHPPRTVALLPTALASSDGAPPTTAIFSASPLSLPVPHQPPVPSLSSQRRSPSPPVMGELTSPVTTALLRSMRPASERSTAAT
ncbi:hypothetical protein PVAP13_1KG280985 [Panicum virgatum]|uniref:Uncharacterized protein n=1 Tax=Panicum virgatum TaxID=38727 RepID=A0A8T0XHR2_PANVG|nr:hypothetical protein PVAP13_1KG280985 [Panicum virgatum]